MRMIFGVLSLLIAVAVVGVLARKQLGALSAVGRAPGTSVDASLPASTPQQQNQQLQNQIKKSVEDAMGQARPEPDDK